MSTCEFYSICHGGCPIDDSYSLGMCKDKAFFSIYQVIEKKLREIIQNEDYGNLNPALTEIILSGFASNKILSGGYYT